MVYCGKPSRGCQNCKTRRIKCDEVRPTCTQCRKSNRVCPGYPDEFDLIFRNETAAVKRRAQRALSSSTHKSSPKSVSSRKSPSTPTEPVLIWDTDTSPTTDWLDIETFSAPALSDTVSSVPATESYLESPLFSQSSPVIVRSVDEPRSQDEESEAALVTAPESVSAGKAPMTFAQLLFRPGSLESPQLREISATAFFMKNYISIPRHGDSMRGYMEILMPMYKRASANSLLHRATQAVALAAISNYSKSTGLRIEAHKAYGKALREVGASIRDPETSRSDELLMSIMLFSLYEAITSTDDSRTAWTRHINGAVTLVKLRGPDQLRNPESLHLFRAVRATMLTSSIQQGKTIEDFPAAGNWRCDEDQGLNAANRLTVICLNLPNIKYYAQDLLARDKTSSTVIDMMTLIRTAKDIDSELEHWALTLPACWQCRIKLVCDSEPDDLRTAEFWTGPVHVYGDLSMANIWDDYRVSRIFCQAVILGCIAALPPHARTEQIERISAQAVHVTRQMVDDFCSTIPFLLGFDLKSRENARGQDEESIKALGAYYAVWPLFVTKKIPCIPDKQKQWLLFRLYHIGKNFGLSEDQMLNMARRHVMTSGPEFE